MNVWYTLALDPDQKSFWAGGAGGHDSPPLIYRFDIETGRIIQIIDIYLEGIDPVSQNGGGNECDNHSQWIFTINNWIPT